MDARRVIHAWPWLYAAVAVVGAVVLLAVPTWKVHWTTYLELFWGLLWLSVFGFIAMTGMVAARWLLRISAIAVAAVYLLNLVIVQSNAPYYGGTDWVVVSILLGVVAAAVVSFMAAGVHPNSALVTDASTSPLRAQCGAAQRER